MHEDRLMYQDTTFAKTSKNEEIIHTIKCFEDVRMNLYKIMEEEIELLKSSPKTYKLAEKLEKEVTLKYQIECNEERIKIIIFDYLPTIYVKTTNKGTGYFVERWKQTINKAIRSLEHIKTVDTVFVYIKMFIPIKFNNFDVDNKNFKPVFDGISRSDLIADDCIKNIKSFAFEVQKDKKNPRTEIYIYTNGMGEKISKLIK